MLVSSPPPLHPSSQAASARYFARTLDIFSHRGGPPLRSSQLLHAPAALTYLQARCPPGTTIPAAASAALKHSLVADAATAAAAAGPAGGTSCAAPAHGSTTEAEGAEGEAEGVKSRQQAQCTADLIPSSGLLAVCEGPLVSEVERRE